MITILAAAADVKIRRAGRQAATRRRSFRHGRHGRWSPCDTHDAQAYICARRALLPLIADAG